MGSRRVITLLCDPTTRTEDLYVCCPLGLTQPEFLLVKKIMSQDEGGKPYDRPGCVAGLHGHSIMEPHIPS